MPLIRPAIAIPMMVVATIISSRVNPRLPLMRGSLAYHAFHAWEAGHWVETDPAVRVAAVHELDCDGGNSCPRKKKNAARLRGVYPLLGGQDCLDADAVRHDEFAREAGFVGV